MARLEASVAKFREIGFALLDHRRRQLFGFFSIDVASQQQIVSHARKAADSAVARVESRFHRSERERSAFGNFIGVLSGCCLEFAVWHDLVDESDLKRLDGS